MLATMRYTNWWPLPLCKIDQALVTSVAIAGIADAFNNNSNNSNNHNNLYGAVTL